MGNPVVAPWRRRRLWFLLFSTNNLSSKMKLLLVAALLVFVLQESNGLPLLGLPPPAMVRSALFTNTMTMCYGLEVTFESGKTKKAIVCPQKPVLVEGIIPHPGWTAVDPITSFTVHCGAHGRATVNVKSRSIELHQYIIGPALKDIGTGCPSSKSCCRELFCDN